MDCRRAEELFSDALEGELHPLLQGELDAHLAACPSCRALRGSFDEVVAVLRTPQEDLPAPEGLARRAADFALSRSREARRRTAAMPIRFQLVAAAVAVVTTAAALRAVTVGEPSRTIARLRDRGALAVAAVSEHSERWIEDLRVLRLLVGTAFEARVDRLNDQVDDYRRLLEKRRSAEPKKDVPGDPPPAQSLQEQGASSFLNPEDARRVGLSVGRAPRRRSVAIA